MTEDYGLSFPLDRVDWIAGINLEALREGRLRRAKQVLFEQNEFGAFLTLNEWNTRYITSTYTPLWTTGSSGLRYALLCRDADQPILYEQGDIGYHTKRFAPWLGDENVKYAITGMGWISRTMGAGAHEQQVGKFVDQIVEDLKKHGVYNHVLATDFHDPFVMAALEKKGVQCSGEGGLALMEARKTKLPDEVQCIRTTTTIGDAMFSALTDSLRPGVSEGELLGEMIRECYRLGGEVVSGCLLTSGPYTWPNLRHYTNRRINYRDVVFADVFNASWNGYKTCYYRTFSVGEPRKATKEAYQRSLDWLYEAIDIIKPGVTTKEIADKWPPGPSIWADIGVTNEDMTAGNHWGHGIGLSLYEPPLIWRGISLEHPMTIEEDMTFAIETQDGDGEGQGVRIEEVLHVTKNGCEILSKWPVEEITVVEI